jgi:hypothetical protein
VKRARTGLRRVGKCAGSIRVKIDIHSLFFPDAYVDALRGTGSPYGLRVERGVARNAPGWTPSCRRTEALTSSHRNRAISMRKSVRDLATVKSHDVV